MSGGPVRPNFRKPAEGSLHNRDVWMALVHQVSLCKERFVSGEWTSNQGESGWLQVRPSSMPYDDPKIFVYHIQEGLCFLPKRPISKTVGW